MIETHPYGSFIPLRTKCLLLGSFPGKEKNDWFYGNKRNQFWSILEEIYRIKLQTRKEKQKLFTALDMAITDIIYQCERKRKSNLDNNLINIVYAVEDITWILETNNITKIFFTSRFVETKFRQLFKNIRPTVKLIALPSPSPRYARMNKLEKIARYRELLPKL